MERSGYSSVRNVILRRPLCFLSTVHMTNCALKVLGKRRRREEGKEEQKGALFEVRVVASSPTFSLCRMTQLCCLRDHSDYVTQPCDIKHLTVWSLFKKWFRTPQDQIPTQHIPHPTPSLEPPLLILSWRVLTHYWKWPNCHVSDITWFRHVV